MVAPDNDSSPKRNGYESKLLLSVYATYVASIISFKSFFDIKDSIPIDVKKTYVIL